MTIIFGIIQIFCFNYGFFLQQKNVNMRSFSTRRWSDLVLDFSKPFSTCRPLSRRFRFYEPCVSFFDVWFFVFFFLRHFRFRIRTVKVPKTPVISDRFDSMPFKCFQYAFRKRLRNDFEHKTTIRNSPNSCRTWFFLLFFLGIDCQDLFFSSHGTAWHVGRCVNCLLYDVCRSRNTCW